MMNEGIRTLYERMVSIICELGNTTAVSRARDIMFNITCDASRIHAYLAGIAVQHVLHEAPVVTATLLCCGFYYKVPTNIRFLLLFLPVPLSLLLLHLAWLVLLLLSLLLHPRAPPVATVLDALSARMAQLGNPGTTTPVVRVSPLPHLLL